MANPKPQDIALWISDQANNIEFKPLRTVIMDILSKVLIAKSTEEIAEISEISEPNVLQELELISNQNLIDGVNSRFEVSLDDQTPYFKVLHTPEFNLRDRLLKGTPTEFEHFCKRILEGLGAKATVEGGPYDQGIDFTGFELPLSSIGPAPIGGFAVVIGQAKRYTVGNNITEKQIREFIGSATRRTYYLKRTHSSKVGSLQPMVYAFWTTSDFHIAAKDFAREMGIWYLSGIALSQLAIRLNVQ